MSFNISNSSLLHPDLHSAVSQDWMNEQQMKDRNEDTLLALTALKRDCVSFIQGQIWNWNHQTDKVYHH